MRAGLINGVRLDTVLVCDAVTIGVANWTQEWLHRRQYGRWGSGILWVFMASRAGAGASRYKTGCNRTNEYK